MRVRVRVRVLAITGAAIATMLLTGCGSTPADDLEDWYSSGGEARIKDLTDDASSVNGLSMGPSDALAPACQKTLTDVAKAEKYGAIPDEDAQEFWSDTLASFKRGASDCTAGAKKQDDALVSQGVVEIQTESLPNLRSTVHLIRVGLDAK